MKPETKEIIAPILRKLDAAASGRVRNLPLASNVYSISALTDASEAFSAFCSAQLARGDDGHFLSLAICEGHQSDAGRIIGEFLNHLLVLSISDRLWSDG